MKVFLGGTCNNSTWRDELMPKLDAIGVEYFNPVVPEWTEAAQKIEREQREKCDYCLYVITPAMTGVYSIAEVIDDSNKRPEKTLFLFLEKDLHMQFTPHQIKSLKATGAMVLANGGTYLTNMEALI